MSEQQKPSEEFTDALFSLGTSCGTCELCEREHFNYEVTDEKEINIYEKMVKKANAEPDRYIDHGDWSVGLGWINGKQVIYDCQCNKLRGYEDFILQHEFIILEFLKNRNEAAKKKLENDEEALRKATEKADE